MHVVKIERYGRSSLQMHCQTWVCHCLFGETNISDEWRLEVKDHSGTSVTESRLVRDHVPTVTRAVTELLTTLRHTCAVCKSIADAVRTRQCTRCGMGGRTLHKKGTEEGDN